MEPFRDRLNGSSVLLLIRVPLSAGKNLQQDPLFTSKSRYVCMCENTWGFYSSFDSYPSLMVAAFEPQSRSYSHTEGKHTPL